MSDMIATKFNPIPLKDTKVPGKRTAACIKESIQAVIVFLGFSKSLGFTKSPSSVKEITMIRIINIAVHVLAGLVVGLCGYYAVTYKFDKLRSVTSENNPITSEVRQAQLTCLARNIYYEAGQEPFEGKVAVAQVTINRSENSQFPSDICKVVYQKNIVYEKILCQFSWYCEQASGLRPAKGERYNESMEVAKQVLLEGFRLPSLKGALYFHGDYINPGWKREKVAHIGRHIFYK